MSSRKVAAETSINIGVIRTVIVILISQLQAKQNEVIRVTVCNGGQSSHQRLQAENCLQDNINGNPSVSPHFPAWKLLMIRL